MNWGIYSVSVLRAFVIAALALLAAYPVRGLLMVARGRRSGRWAWIFLLAPLLTPSLVVGYAYWNNAIALERYAWLKEALYGAVMVARLTAVTAAALYLAPPPPISAQGEWCARLARGFKLGFMWRGPFLNGAAAFAVAFLLAFIEFEIASLLGIKTWSVWLFDAQVGGLILGESLRRSIIPLLCQLVVLAPVLALVYRRRQLPAPAAFAPHAARLRTLVIAWAYLLIAVTIATVIPAFDMLAQTLPALATLPRHFALYREVGASLATALCAAGIVTVLAKLLAEGGTRRLSPLALAGLLVLSLPGLLGSLLLSMTVLALFSHASALREGPLPLLLAQVLLVLPIGLLLQALLQGLSRNSAVHTAQLLARGPVANHRAAGRKILWDLKDRAGGYVFLLVFLWAYFDVCTGTLLRPSKMPLAPDALYNLMHYGQSAAMATSLLLVVAAPLLLWTVVVLAWSGFRFWATHE